MLYIAMLYYHLCVSFFLQEFPTVGQRIGNWFYALWTPLLPPGKRGFQYYHFIKFAMVIGMNKLHALQPSNACSLQYEHGACRHTFKVTS